MSTSNSFIIRRLTLLTCTDITVIAYALYVCATDRIQICKCVSEHGIVAMSMHRFKRIGAICLYHHDFSTTELAQDARGGQFKKRLWTEVRLMNPGPATVTSLYTPLSRNFSYEGLGTEGFCTGFSCIATLVA